MYVSPRQISAARSILGWTMTELAKNAKLSITTVSDVERDEVQPTLKTLAKLRDTLEAAGIEFIMGNADGIGEGVRIQKKRRSSKYLSG
jgi:transcriptional regulator with XRE-family HTH domain